jgi:hypothetical protein
MDRLNVSVAALVIAIPASAVAQQASQWRVEDGGNGHWYRVSVASPGISWTAADAAAAGQGGYLASVLSGAESAFVATLASATPRAFTSNPGGNEVGPWLGGTRILGTNGWRWTSGEAWGYTQWCAGEPNGGSGEPYVHLMRNGSTICWNDRENNAFASGNPSYVIEYSADCNGDGVVDFGQILSGHLSDVNANGVPDCCETGQQCGCIADIFVDGVVNGADLGVVLSQWGQGAGAASDINRDGVVDGADLAILLGNWGPCPN